MTISKDALDQLFNEAHTHNYFSDKPVADETLKAAYDLAKFPPTAANSNPLRILFVKSPEAKEKLKPTLSPGNLEKTMTAPVTAIVAYDIEFYEKLPELFPHTDARSWYAGKPAFIQETAFRNGTLGAAYFIIAARAVGLDCGPMSGFNNVKVDEAFFAGTTWKSNFLINLGYGDASKLHARNPRLEFDEAAKVI